MDQHLYTTKGSPPNSVLWRPQKGSSVALNATDYRPFSQVVRTVHLNDALDICLEHCIEPKFITSFSNLKSYVLPPYHPCKKIQVLWFGAKNDDTEEDAPDWYGNVEFAISVDTLMHRWKNYYLVEMMTAPTHSITRILVTNSDYSSVLPLYDPHRYGGGWYLTPDGLHERLADCRRYNSEGYNKHGHTLEFMIEVTPFGRKKLLEEAQISFRNHEMAVTNGPHVCHRFKGPPNCPTPFSRAYTSKWFFQEHHRLNAHRPMATPKLSPSAEEFLQCFLTMEGIPRNNLLVLAPPACPPPFSNQHFPPLSQPSPSFIISQFLQQRMENGKVKNLHHMLGREQDNVFRLIAESITKPKTHPDDEEEEQVVVAMMAGQLPVGPPPGFLPPPPPFGIPPLHLPPPPLHLPPVLFQHSWGPLEPITFRRRN